MMDEKRFDELWERAEAGRYADNLAAEYPAWRTRQRRVMGIAALVLVAGATLPLLTKSSQPQAEHESFTVAYTSKTQPQAKHENYTMAYCNRADMADEYWVNMAEELLKS